MKMILTIATGALMLAAGSAAAQGVPLQPANQPEIFDFSQQVNDPNAPGNRDTDIGNMPEVAEEPVEFSDMPEQTDDNGATPVPAPAPSSGGVDGFSILAGVLVVLLSAGAASAWYWYKTRKPL